MFGKDLDHRPSGLLLLTNIVFVLAILCLAKGGVAAFAHNQWNQYFGDLLRRTVTVAVWLWRN